MLAEPKPSIFKGARILEKNINNSESFLVSKTKFSREPNRNGGTDSPAEISGGLDVGGEAGEEIGAKSRGVLGKGEGVVELAAELVVIGGDTGGAGWVDESAAGLGQNGDHPFRRWSFNGVVWRGGGGGGGGFGDFGRREGGGGRSFARRVLLLKERHFCWLGVADGFSSDGGEASLRRRSVAFSETFLVLVMGAIC